MPSTPNTPGTAQNTANAIQALHALNIPVFVSSGNDGHDNGIAFPACVAEAISVGGVYDASVGGISWCGNANCSTILCTDNPTSADVFVCHTNSGSLLGRINYVADEVTGLERVGGRVSGVVLASGAAIACGTVVNAAQLTRRDSGDNPQDYQHHQEFDQCESPAPFPTISGT